MRTLAILYFASVCHACAASARPGAVAQVAPFSPSSSIEGQLTFTETKEGVLVQGQVTGLQPHSQHGFHVHEVGDCSSPEAPKGHFNPKGEEHGAGYEQDSHLGDLGNIFADDKGVAHISLVKQGAKVKQGESAYIGHAVIVHEGSDDLNSQPAGAAGKPAACGVIKIKSRS